MTVRRCSFGCCASDTALEISQDAVRHDISQHLDHVARMLRIARQAAKYYVTDDVINALADRIARAVHQQQAVDLDTERRRRRRPAAPRPRLRWGNDTGGGPAIA